MTGRETQARIARAARAEALGWRFVATYDCPRRLRHQRCLVPQCWCRSPLNVNGGMWREIDSGRKFVLWEPEAGRAQGDALAKILTTASRVGMAAGIAPSVWDPPRTVGIRFDAEMHYGRAT